MKKSLCKLEVLKHVLIPKNKDMQKERLTIFFFFVFLGLHPWHMESPRLGSNWICSCRPMPEPQQRGIQATFATYTAAHGNTRSLTH